MFAPADATASRTTATDGGDGGPEGSSAAPSESRPATPVVVGALALAATSLFLPGSPTYDPWSWLLWGREIVHLDLDTRGGPAWKPLPVLFTTVFSLAGKAAPALWLVVARAGAVLAVAMAFRLARRLAGPVAGVVAAVSLLSSSAYLGYLVPTGMSEPLLAGLVLWAVERHLDGRHTQAYGLWFAAALLRPEVWPFLALYALFAWRRVPGSRRLVAITLLSLPMLWFLPEAWGSGDLLRSSQRAQVPNPGDPLLAQFPGLAVLESARSYLGVPVQLGALLAVVVALVACFTRRQEKRTLLVALLGAAWLAIVTVMTQLGLAAGEQRFLIVAAAAACVLAGVGWAKVVDAAGALARRLSGHPRVGVVGQALATILLLLVALPYAVPRVDELRAEAEEVRFQTALHDMLPVAIERAGGSEKVLACGGTFTGRYLIPALAWQLDVPFPRVGFMVGPPGIVFRSPHTRFAVPEPDAPVAELGFPVVARAGTWEVGASCPAYGSRADAGQ